MKRLEDDITEEQKNITDNKPSYSISTPMQATEKYWVCKYDFTLMYCTYRGTVV